MSKGFFSALLAFTLIATPVFAADEYTASYVCPYGGTPPATETVAYGDNYTVAQNTCTVPTGYRFKYWKLDEAKYPGETFTWTYTKDQKFYAAIENDYTITYDCGNGTGSGTKKYTAVYNDSFTPSYSGCKVPSGYYLSGWAVSGTNDVKPNRTAFTWLYTEDKTLTAQYSNTTTITYSCGKVGGTPPASTTATYGQDYTLANYTCNTPAGQQCYWLETGDGKTYKPGETFTWNISSINVTLEAYCEAAKYTINYVYGENSGSESVAYGETYKPKECKVVGYTCSDWAVSGTNDTRIAGTSYTWDYTEDKTFTATLTPVTYAVSYDCDKGTGTPPSNTTATYDASFTPAANTCTPPSGTVFLGWHDGKYIRPAGTAFIWQYPSKHAFKAVYDTAISYTITYSCGSGSGYAPSVRNYIKSGDTVDPSDIGGCKAPTGYTFDGWDVSGTNEIQRPKTSFTWNYNENKTFTARYTPIVTTVKYDCGEFEGTPPTATTATYGTLFTLPSNTCTPKKGYQFAGWAMNGESSDIRSAGASFTWEYESTEFKIGAVYEPVTYTVSYSCNGGSGDAPSNDSIQYGKKFTAAMNSCTKYGYEFKSWAISGTDRYVKEGGAIDPWEYTENKTLSADWVRLESTVTYKCGDGTGNPPSGTSVYYGNSFTPAVSDCTVPSGYTFYGWMVSDTNDVVFSGTSFTWEYMGNKTLTAVYTLPPYTVTYSCGEGGSGTPPSSTTALYNVPFTPAANTCSPATGFYFTEWLVSGTTDTKPAETAFIWKYNENKTFSAKYDKIRYTVSYSCGEGTGTPPADGTATYGDRFNIATDAICAAPAGYMDGIDKWLISGTNVTASPGTAIDPWNYTENKTLIATYKPKKFEAKYSCGIGTSTTPPNTDTVIFGSVYTPATPTDGCGVPDGYTAFAGWSVKIDDTTTEIRPAGTQFTWNYTDNELFTATFTPKKFTVKYSCGEGTGTAPANADAYYNTPFTPAANTCVPKTGYEFEGWLVDDAAASIRPAGVAFTYTYRDNIKLTAKYKPSTYNVTYSCGPGAGTPPTATTATYGQSFTTAANTCTAPTVGYDTTFRGWTISGTGGVAGAGTGSNAVKHAAGSTFTWEYTEDKVLTATWDAKTYKVKYECDGSTGTPPAIAIATYDAEFTPATSTCTPPAGHVFKNWVNGYDQSDTRLAGVPFVWKYTSDQTFKTQYRVLLSSEGLCSYDYLETYGPSAELEGDWTPNDITLHWYNDNSEINVTNTNAASCTYDGLVVPATTPTKTGYTFGGWQLQNCWNNYTCGMNSGMVGTAPTWDAQHVRWKPLNGNSGLTMQRVFGTENSSDLNNGELAISFDHGTVKAVVSCNATVPDAWSVVAQGISQGTMSDAEAIGVLTACSYENDVTRPTNTFTSGATGSTCWVKMTSYTPTGGSQCNMSSAKWALVSNGYDSTESCAKECAPFAAKLISNYSSYRRALFGSGTSGN